MIFRKLSLLTIFWLMIFTKSTKSDKVYTKPNKNEVTNYQYYDKKNFKKYGEPSLNDLNIIVERLTRLESLVLNQQLMLQKYQKEIKEEVSVIRNATILLLTIVSGQGSECQGLVDTTTKIKILHSTLAAFDPYVKHIPLETGILESTSEVFFNSSDKKDILPEVYIEPVEEIGSKNSGLESDDLVLEHFQLEKPTLIVPKVTLPPTTPTTPEPLKFTTTIKMVTKAKKVSTTSTTTTTGAPIVCPKGSKPIGRECFSLHIDERLNWTSSRGFCRNMGGDLAEPNLFNNRLPRQLARAWPQLKRSSYWTLWVGATDQEIEGEWHWVTGGLLDLKESSRWDLGDALDLGEKQDCLAMILWIPGKFQRWDLLDDHCDLEWYVFCEYSRIS